MAIRHFAVGPARGLRHAAADGLPNLVVIAGPNGAGKSTLLDQLRKRSNDFAEPGTEVTYLGPHRPWRKATLGGAHLYQMPYTYRQYLGMPQLPSWDQVAPPGLQYIAAFGERSPQSSDEAFSLVKFSIAKKGLARLNLMQQIFETQGEQIAPGAMPDVFGPLRKLTQFLLPHLSFDGVHTLNERDIRVDFRRVDGDAQSLIDVDELSSGEKAIVALFWPFLERQIDQLIAQGTASVPEVLPTALIDEPDLHLHPTLQVSLIDYLRALSNRGEAQFVITTHSPTILDALSDEELFLLAPVAAAGDANQFIRVATSHERLETIRSVTGSTHLLTRCRPIVYLEGERPTGRQPSDQRLVELLIPQSSAWVTVPSMGKREAIRAATVLREAATEGLPGVPVFALVDADQRSDGDPDWAITWPVAMVENLLLDPEAIWAFLAPHREHVPLTSSHDVAMALSELARSRRHDEVRLRVLSGLRPFRVSLDVNDPTAMAEAFRRAHEDLDAQFLELGGADGIAALATAATTQVDAILEAGRELEAFHGKKLLRSFLDRYCRGVPLGPRVFAYEVAQRAAVTDRTTRLVGAAVGKIRSYVPAGLPTTVRAAMEALPDDPQRVPAMNLTERAEEARRQWELGNHGSRSEQEALRASVFALAHTLRQCGLTEVNRALLAVAVELGTG